MTDCAFLIQSENEDELVAFVQQHAEETHETSIPRENVENLMVDV